MKQRTSPKKLRQMIAAKRKQATPAMRIVAREEGVSLSYLMTEIAAGRIVIPANPAHTTLVPRGIGGRLKIKVNANIGTSEQYCNLAEELKKRDTALKYGADAVMDLSTAGKLDMIREKIITTSPVPVGTVPIYQTVVEHGIEGLSRDTVTSVIKKHAASGVDFITIHSGITRDVLLLLKKRVTGVVSRGGSFITRFMEKTGKENPYYEFFDDILAVAQEHDVALSLGDGLRPGCIADATDKAQLHELRVLGRLAKRAWSAGVQVIIEGPGHLPFDQIRKNMELQKKLCHGAPFYVLGPLVTDIAAGYDHIAGAIGGTLAACTGASFLCYVTPAEHLRLPTRDDVREGVIASKIAAHAVDIARGNKKSIARNRTLSEYRKQLDWKKQFPLLLDPEKAQQYRTESNMTDEECTMCGKYCSMK